MEEREAVEQLKIILEIELMLEKLIEIKGDFMPPRYVNVREYCRNRMNFLVSLLPERDKNEKG